MSHEAYPTSHRSLDLALSLLTFSWPRLGQQMLEGDERSPERIEQSLLKNVSIVMLNLICRKYQAG